jgi:hypothetical protein
MAQTFKETAHLKTDLAKYQDNHDHIFNRANCKCEECIKEDKEIEARIVIEDFKPNALQSK